MNNTMILSWMTFLPLGMALLLSVLPKSVEQIPNFSRLWTLASSLISVLMACQIYSTFDASSAAYQMSFSIPWIADLGLNYAMGIDGISLPLVMLTALITPIALLGTWSGHALKRERFFFAMILLLQTGMYGTFLSTDLFLFYFFWEIVLIPMFFLIGIWGGENRIYATVKFFIYTMVGSLLMLVAIFYMARTTYSDGGMPQLSFQYFAEQNWSFDPNNLMGHAQWWLFLAFALAFVIKVPMVPFHTWLPDAHVQAPTLGSVFLAAVLLKMGTYGLMRIAIPFFPQAAAYCAPAFYFLGIVGIIYGAMCALAQTDFKKLVAYSSVSHMGYIIIGLFTFEKVATTGALYQMINHGISAAGLFMIVGILYERCHTRNLEEFGHLAKVVPLTAIAFMLVTLSSVALPGTNGFVGEFTILLGTFQVAPWVAFLAGTGVIMGAVYSLRAYQLVMFGPENPRSHFGKIPDLGKSELLAMALLAVFIFGIGFFPQSFFAKSQATLDMYMTSLSARLGAGQ